MKISSKNEFHTLVSSLRSLLSENGVNIKTSRAQELLSRSLGYKSANGLYASLPVEIDLTHKVFEVFDWILQEKHEASDTSGAVILRELESTHRSYSTRWGSDAKCYPTQLSETENYWYLTNDGWLPWKDMDFARMRVELNIYKVVHSNFGPFLDEHSFSGSARPIWTADIASTAFEVEAARLEREYGDMPNKDLMFAVAK
ncbi:hypothetical protein [Marinobacter salsuginis]|uniref:hypothetical protein n=1 Tax=Marinobacter salsuginis TaxID=418719 RepID=UPI00273E0222|nr:hypothetical protein [Marinobacter salsuginis]